MKKKVKLALSESKYTNVLINESAQNPIIMDEKFSYYMSYKKMNIRHCTYLNMKHST
jgi:hypothetical protein